MIKTGDIVSVHMNSAQITIAYKALVQNIPRATGESWQFITQPDYGISEEIWTSEPITVTLLESV